MYDKIISFSCPLILPWYPWFWFRNDETLIRKLGSRFIWFNTKSISARIVLVFKSLIWPLITLIGLILDWAYNAGEVKRVFKVVILSQLLIRIRPCTSFVRVCNHLHQYYPLNLFLRISPFLFRLPTL